MFGKRYDNNDTYNRRDGCYGHNRVQNIGGYMFGKKISTTVLFAGLFFSVGAVHAGALFKGVYGWKNTSATSMSEQIAIGDIYNQGVKRATQTLDTSLLALPGRSNKALFYLDHRFLERLVKVEVNGTLLVSRDPDTWVPNYTYHAENGWISFKPGLISSGDDVKVFYDWSDQTSVVAPYYTGGSTYKKFKNTGNFTFSNQDDNVYSPGGKGYGVAIADYNADGFSDIMIGCEWGNPAMMFNDPGTPGTMGNTQWPLWRAANILNVYPRPLYLRMAVADFDSDGLVDMWGLGAYSQQGCRGGLARRLSTNKGFSPIASSRMWGNFPQWRFSGYPAGAAFADFNNDGAMDFVTSISAATPEKLGVFRNVMTGGWAMLIGSNGPPMAGDPISGGTPKTLLLEPNGWEIESYSSSYGADSIGGAVWGDSIYVIRDPAGGSSVIERYDRSDFWTVLATVSVPVIIPTEQYQYISDIAVDHRFLYAVGAAYNAGSVPFPWRLYKIDKDSLVILSSVTFFNRLGFTTGGPAWSGVAIDPSSQYVYVADYEGKKLRKFDALTLAEDPVNFDTSPDSPQDVAVDNDYLYYASKNTGKIIRRSKDLSQANPGSPTFSDNFYSNLMSICVDTNTATVYGKNPYNIYKLSQNLTLLQPAQRVDAVGNTYGFYQIGCGGFQSIKTHPRMQLQFSSTSYFVYSMDAADLDNDGDLDLITGGGGRGLTTPVNIPAPSPNTIWRNDGVDANGDTIFTPVWTDPSDQGAMSIATGDIDQDGRQDVVFSYFYSTWTATGRHLEVYLNKGGFNFTQAWKNYDDAPAYYNYQPADVKLVDMNKDGLLDLVVGASNQGDTTKFANVVIYGNNGLTGGKTVLVTTTTTKNGVKMKVVSEYLVKPDGTLGKKLKTWIP